jgi:hypothetical protein
MVQALQRLISLLDPVAFLTRSLASLAYACNP